MMHALKIAGSAKLPRLAALLVAVAGLGLAGCDDHPGDPRNADRRQSRTARAAAVSDAVDGDRKSRRMGR